MYREICLFFILGIGLLNTGTSLGQGAPGYEGHKFSLTYDYIAHPKMDVFTDPVNYKTSNSSQIRLVYSQSVGMNYVLTRHTSLGASYQFFMLGEGSTEDMFHHSGSGYIISIFTKHFYGGSIAPLGRYIRPELCFMNYSGTGQVPVTSGSAQLVTIPFQGGYHLGYTWSFGRTYILFNHFMIDRGMRFSLLNMVRYSSGDRYSRATTSRNYDPAIEEVVANQCVNFFIGIGILP